jgi:hypothetical protein
VRSRRLKGVAATSFDRDVLRLGCGKLGGCKQRIALRAVSRYREKTGQKCHNRRERDEQHRVTNLRAATKST